MFSRTKGLVVAAALAAASVPTFPGSASAASPCRVVPVPLQTKDSQPVLVAGAYTTAGAIDVILTCGVVRDGETAVLVTDGLTGPVAALEEDVRVSPGTFTSCYELRVVYLNRPATVSDTCP